MSEATEKQTKILLDNGFEQADIDQLNKKAISDAIGKIYANKGWGEKDDKQGSKPVSNPTSRHDVIINRTEKPHSFEFGKAGKRHKIYYCEIIDLIAHVDTLKEAGLIDEDEPIPEQDLTLK